MRGEENSLGWYMYVGNSLDLLLQRIRATGVIECEETVAVKMKTS